MSDQICLRGLTAFGYHGVLDAERLAGQDFVIDVELDIDLAKAAASDDIADTVHYGQLAQRLTSVVTGDPVQLIETLAGRLADVCLSFDGVLAASVTVHKPHAPIAATFGDVSVTIRRRRP